mmetsp:Transcript_52143/g.91637  ORF Transcript_52143/g.91637 Transcript_52143/m.91637 type:complete len:200 (-) Transcript_52143:178-777(-)
MHKFALVLCGLVCAAHGRRVQPATEPAGRSTVTENQDSAKALATLLLGHDPALAFHAPVQSPRASLRSSRASPVHRPLVKVRVMPIEMKDLAARVKAAKAKANTTEAARTSTVEADEVVTFKQSSEARAEAKKKLEARVNDWEIPDDQLNMWERAQRDPVRFIFLASVTILEIPIYAGIITFPLWSKDFDFQKVAALFN